MFDGFETILQGSNSDHEIAAARTQHPCEHRMIRIRNVLPARTPLLGRNVGVQGLNRARKVGDQHPDLLRPSRRNATFGSELTMMLHFIPPDCPSWTQARSNGAVGKEASKEGAVKNGMEHRKFRRRCVLRR